MEAYPCRRGGVEVLGEDGLDGAGEATEHVVAGEGVVFVQGFSSFAGAVYVDGLGFGVDYPHERYAVVEPHLGSVVCPTAAFCGGDDFYY